MEIDRTLTTLFMVGAAGLWAGGILFYAIERVNLWSRMPLDQYVVDFRRSVRRADPLQPILAILSVLAATIWAIHAGGMATQFAWAGVGLILATVIFSIALPERINRQFRTRPEGEAPPHTEELRKRWRTLHLVRTVPAIAAFGCLVVATAAV